MIEYIRAENPDDRTIERAAKLLKLGKLIAFPTDTSWIIAGDPFNKNVVQKLYKLKGEKSDKHFSLLCDNISRASQIAIIEDIAFKIINRIIPGHYTFIFEAAKVLTKNLKASKSDHEVGLRFPPIDYIQKIIKAFDGVLISTNITQEMLGLSEDDFIYGLLIDEAMGSSEVSMIIDPGEVDFAGLSTIIKFSPEIELVRAGAGDYSFLSV